MSSGLPATPKYPPPSHQGHFLGEIVIPEDDPNIVREYDPYSLQGMVNALTYFTNDAGGSMEIVEETGNMIVARIDGVQIVIVPTPNGLQSQNVLVICDAESVVTRTSIFNPNKVEFDEGEPIRFFSSAPAAVLAIHNPTRGRVTVELKTMDMRRPDRVNGAVVEYTV